MTRMLRTFSVSGSDSVTFSGSMCVSFEPVKQPRMTAPVDRCGGEVVCCPTAGVIHIKVTAAAVSILGKVLRRTCDASIASAIICQWRLRLGTTAKERSVVRPRLPVSLWSVLTIRLYQGLECQASVLKPPSAAHQSELRF